jgi:DJ-1 family protein
MKALLFLAEGFEEIEAISTVDILRRGGVRVETVSITKEKEVKGAHHIPVVADCLLEEINTETADMLILPGGLPGSTNLNAHEGLKKSLTAHYNNGKYIAAICAAPLVFGELGLLQGKKAVCYPGIEPQLIGATIVDTPVVQDGNIITGKGPGLAFHFGLKLIALLKGQDKADEVAAGMLLD